MARVVNVEYYCDRTAARHAPFSTPADTLTVYQRQKRKLVEIDICEACQSRLTDAEAQEIALTKGRDLTVPELDPDLLCPHGCNKHKPYKSQASLERHLARKHPEDVAA